ncbi:type I glutamate--ammonia ligase [Salinibacterium sp. NG253]|uniref:type I glutamate--ammonia ligase n=1 Tax=unclassified Salinibacterium TaxID=2632331 RepID=UPI0018CC90D8|nr:MULTISPECIES: type I glutamate--ammonia ligase [unclassified Salinibacterium]MBH0115604.1 type I glutamate--ammonia ligase [Salinibacterium sp. NG253]MBH0129139.1 type I glutamate--ammonia ligase [Salinibacterium sp. NK8237]
MSHPKFSNSSEVLDFIKDTDVKFVDIRFTDLPGIQQHFNIPAASVDEDFFAVGQLFDGSSIRGFQSIHESDLQLIPDVSTAYVDPFRVERTLVIIFDIYNPRNGEIYARDPRQVAKKAEKYLTSTGIADTAFFASEAEFYIFDDVRYEVSANKSFYEVDSSEGAWNSGRTEAGGNLANKTPFKGGYFPVSPVDQHADIRDDIVMKLIDVGLDVERSHHEVGTAGQGEINYKFDTLVHAGDDILKFKYIVKNTANEWGKTATFMPKPLFGDNGSGMHTHQSLWNDGTPLFYDEKGYGGLSDTARWYIGGLLKHAPAVLAFTNPTVNSYRRLIPGFEAPVNLVYSAGNRSASIRIPITGTNPKAKRIEFRAPDASGNPYLAFAAQLMAGLDGIKNKTEPHEPVDKDLYELPPEEARLIPQVPASLEEALVALEADHEFLMEGNVFTKDLIETWIDYKRTNELLPFAQRPHPYEYELYFGV